MVTIEKKDILISYILAQDEFLTDIEVSNLREDGITYDECNMILRQLEKMGLVDLGPQYADSSGFTIAVNASLHDFHSRGGFKAQELILLTNLEKLESEFLLLQCQLEPDKLEQFNKVISLFTSACNMIPYIQSLITAAK